jgi:hypothetical protein
MINRQAKCLKQLTAITVTALSATVVLASPAYAWRCNSVCKPWQPDCFAWKQLNFNKCHRTDTYINDPQPTQEELYRQDMLRRQQIENQQRQELIRQENLRRQQEQQRQQEQLRLQEQERQRQLLMQQNQSRREQDVKNLRLYLDNMLRAESPRCQSYADARVSAALGQLTYGQGLSGIEMNRIGNNAFNECMFPVRQRADQIYNNEMQRINSIRY